MERSALKQELCSEGVNNVSQRRELGKRSHGGTWGRG